MRTCPRCGLQLPATANYCARCGGRLSAPEVASWVLIIFWTGCVIALLGSVLYGLAAADPGLGRQSGAVAGVDPAELQTATIAIAVAAGVLFVVQLAASIGLALGRAWGRVLATLACVAWALTCIGLPVTLLVLAAIWRPRVPPRPPAPAPGTSYPPAP